MKVRISRGIANEYITRDVFPFAWDAGVHEFTEREFDDMLDDANHYANPQSTDMDRSTRMIYARHLEKLKGLVR